MNYYFASPGRPSLQVLLAEPRGFCAGVVRAIQTVELALEKFGAPVYVRHEIVHNRHVVERLEKIGAVFVSELDDVPEGVPVIFSAHGVPKSVPVEARRRELLFVDATCPLVSKVHVEADRHYRDGLEIVLIGHEGHPEVIGTLGQLPPGAITLVETVADALTFSPNTPERLAYITQTTLSVDDTAEIIACLKARFPEIVGPRKDDICYATTNRQDAVKQIAARCDAMLVIGAPNSSNSMRLIDVAKKNGCAKAWLVEHAGQIDWDQLGAPECLGVTAGASAPEELVEDVLNSLRTRFEVCVEGVKVTDESVTFKLPRTVCA